MQKHTHRLIVRVYPSWFSQRFSGFFGSWEALAELKRRVKSFLCCHGIAIFVLGVSAF